MTDDTDEHTDRTDPDRDTAPDSRRQARLDDVVGTGGEGEVGGERGTDEGDRDEPVGSSAGDGSGMAGSAIDPAGDDVAETIELGVALLAHLEDGDLPLAAAVDRIETVTTDPALTREILDTAELRGLIAREEGLVRSRSGAFVRFERDVVRREGEFTCRRCGASLSTGHFLRFDAGEHGPFGSSCIRKVIGRD